MYTKILSNFQNNFPETKKVLFDIVALVITIIVVAIFLMNSDMAEVLYKFSREHESYNLDEILLTIAFSSFLFIVFILRRFFELQNMIKKANTDPLTGVLNRRKGTELIENAINNSKEASLIMFDIDDFKYINDSFGHNIGDVVLKEISYITIDTTRKNDVFIRWGGEEFIILCTDTSLEMATSLANRLKVIIENYQFCTKSTITSSFGVTSLNKKEDLRSQINRVDALLYISKKNGKNQVNSSS